LDLGDWTVRAQLNQVSPSSGGVETPVTLTGQGFGTATGTVTINGAAAGGDHPCAGRRPNRSEHPQFHN
jgi:hypothetical protein